MSSSSRTTPASSAHAISPLNSREPMPRPAYLCRTPAITIAEWRLRGSHRIQLEVATDRTAARSLYDALGFVEQGRYFEIAPVASRLWG